MKKILASLLLFGFFQALHAQDITIPAQFPGGDTAWQKYLDTSLNQKQLITPANQKDVERFGTTQRVVYNFGIMTDGSIGLITIEGQISQVIRNEIHKVLKNSPKWTPATYNGKPVVYRKKQISTFTFE